MEKLNQEEEKRVLENIGLVKWRLKIANISNEEYDDFFQVGMIGLINASKKFDETKGISFSTYATTSIYNNINTYYKNNSKYKNVLSLNQHLPTPFEQGGESSLELEIAIEDEISTDFISKIENLELIEKAVNIILNKFSITEMLILLYLAGGVTQDVIAKNLNIFRIQIYRKKVELYPKLKMYVNSNIKMKKKVFEVKLKKEKFQIAFTTTTLAKFKEAFISFLFKTSDYQKLKNFSITSDKNGKIVMKLPADADSFVIIAQILQEAQTFGVEFLEKNY